MDFSVWVFTLLCCVSCTEDCDGSLRWLGRLIFMLALLSPRVRWKIILPSAWHIWYLQWFLVESELLPSSLKFLFSNVLSVAPLSSPHCLPSIIQLPPQLLHVGSSTHLIKTYKPVSKLCLNLCHQRTSCPSALFKFLIFDLRGLNFWTNNLRYKLWMTVEKYWSSCNSLFSFRYNFI